MSLWWRAYSSARHDPKIQRLPGELFKAWFNLVCLAGERNGVLPSIEDVAFELRKSVPAAQKIVDALVAATLLDETETGFTPHNWNARQFKSDVSTTRVKQFRKRQRNVSVTPSETEPETEQRSEAKASGAADVASVIFGNGLDWLKRHSGKSEPDCRSLLGKWRKTLGDEALIATIGRAQREGALDPVGWMEAAIKAQKATRPTASGGWN